MKEISVSEVLELYAGRDAAAQKEQELEEVIFGPKQFSPQEARALGNEYRRLKDKRSEASVRAAVAYATLPADMKKEVTDKWEKTKEGTRKKMGSGIRGAQNSYRNNQKKK